MAEANIVYASGKTICLVSNTTWVTGSDADGWWVAKEVQNAPTYREVKTRTLPHVGWMKPGDASEDLLRINTSTNGESMTGDIAISRTSLNYFTRMTPAVKEAHQRIAACERAAGGLVIADAILARLDKERGEG